MALKPGTQLGPYQVQERLGAGGMGEVYRAHDNRLQRDVAIKILRPGLLIDEGARSRFRKEALALARLNHPNIAVVYDVGEHDAVDYLVMEYVPGPSLAEKLGSGPCAIAEALSLGIEIASALEEAHEQGVIHRDLKPGNVALTAKGHAKVLDFGLAKLLEPEQDITLSRGPLTHGPIGTLLYMSPEQAEGRVVDARTDLWSLGALLYESLAGKPPFSAGSAVAILHAVTTERVKSVRQLRADTPAEVERILTRALEKDPERRYPTASEMKNDLTAALGRATAGGPQGRDFRMSGGRVVWLALLVALVAGIGGWFYWQLKKVHWAQEEAIPRIARLREQDKPLAAFLLAGQAKRFLADDKGLNGTLADMTEKVTIDSTPEGATVAIQDYLTPQGPWYRVGITPLKDAVIPKGYFRWKLTQPRTGEQITAPDTEPAMTFALSDQASAPARMVSVGGGEWEAFVTNVGSVGPFQLPMFYIDKYEVTNREYQRFVDAGGYDKQEYWKEKVIKDGQELSWHDAMELFRDSTGRHGPSTWQGGHFPQGQEDYPVSGVSWYEASAYAAFAHKSLPTLAQWYKTISPDAATYATQMSNIDRLKLEAVGSFQDVGVYGTYDLAGNVREWIENAVGDRRFILGGAWNSQTYLYTEPEALLPFDRSAGNGFRCVLNKQPLPSAASEPLKGLERDFTKIKPVSDEVFAAYKAMYSYEDPPLNARVEGVVAETADWKQEKITFDTAYDQTRMAAYLFLPKKVRAPYETILFFPSARVLEIPDSSALGDIKFFDYIVQSGRAVMYPIYQGTYERNKIAPWPLTLQLSTERLNDLSRSIEYLATRPDINKDELAYVGVSMGSAEGVTLATLLQDKFRTVILLDGGFFPWKLPPGLDQVDFAPRLKLPVLMVNGRYDFSFSLSTSQNPLYAMLGTPASDKRHVVLESPHDVTVRRGQLVKEVLAWLDKYLGPVD
ncbi:MAG TPA: protein kinase [Terriglobales bacterium]|jgi:formylglycine-generating enzyme required for sulfatase activity/dienelactone hydrolase